MSETVSDADAIAKANCKRCGAKKGSPCVYTKPSQPCYPVNQAKYDRIGKPTKRVHQERREAAWRSAPRNSYTFRVDRIEYEELLDDSRRLREINRSTPLPIGATLHGYCGGAFGRESYDDKIIEATGRDWVIVRSDHDGVEFYAGDLNRLREYL